MLSFTETVQASTFNVQALTLQSSDDSRLGETYTLTNSTASTVDALVINITLSVYDSNNIKILDSLATDEANTYVVLTMDLVRDMSSVPIEPVVDRFGQRVRYFTPDTTSPEIVRAELDLTTDSLTLYFTESVRVSEIILTTLSLLSSAGSNISLNLTGGTVSPNNAPMLTITLLNEDLNKLKENDMFATNTSNVYISFTDNFIQDMAGNAILPVNQTNAFAILSFTPDRVPPYLIEFVFNMNIGSIYLVFSETVRVTTFNASGLTLASSASSVATAYPIANNGLLISPVNSPAVGYMLSISDTNNIKSMLSLATSLSNTFLRLERYTIRDMNGNIVIARSDSTALQAIQYISDATAPTLLSFDLDLTLSNVSSAAIAVVYL